MNLKIVGQSLVVTSSLKTDTIKKAEKLVPKSLVLMQGEGEDKEQVCKLGIAYDSGVSKAGLNFSSTSADGLAQATILLPNVKADERKGWVEDNYGMTFVYAAQIEAQVEAALNEHANTIDTIFGNIEVQ